MRAARTHVPALTRAPYQTRNARSVNAQGVDNPGMFMNFVQQAHNRGEAVCHFHLDTSTALGPY